MWKNEQGNLGKVNQEFGFGYIKILSDGQVEIFSKIIFAVPEWLASITPRSRVACKTD